MRRFDLLPIAVGQLQIFYLIHRYREQAPSHIESSPGITQRCFMRSMMTASSRIEPRITYW